MALASSFPTSREDMGVRDPLMYVEKMTKQYGLPLEATYRT